MSSLDSYISALTKLRDNLPEIVDNAINLNSGKIVGFAQHRLFNFGEDGNHGVLRKYKKSTIGYKKLKNAPYDRTTLIDQGGFYKGMFVNSKDGRVELFSDDSKSALLTGDYGKAILEFTIEEQEEIVSEIVKPSILKEINSLPNIIKLEIK